MVKMINTEMNYWPVEVLNIAECHEALFKMIDEVALLRCSVCKAKEQLRQCQDGWLLSQH